MYSLKWIINFEEKKNRSQMMNDFNSCNYIIKFKSIRLIHQQSNTKLID